MTHRPPALNLNNGDNHEALPPPPRYPNFYMDLPSPRTGEAPPALSPLDAFALQSRMLAKKFDEEAQNGRRLSRLHPNAVAREIATRPAYFRGISGGSDGGMSDVPEVQEVQEDSRPATRSGVTYENTEVRDRPTSHYPMLGRISRQEDDLHQTAETPFFDARENQARNLPDSYFDIPRAMSPEADDPKVNIEAPSPNLPSLTNSVESFSSSQHPRTLTDGSTKSQRSERGLLPPRSPVVPKSPRSVQSSIRAVLQDSDDEATSSINSPSMATSARKLSASSGYSRPQSPYSASFVHHVGRSPSMTSEYSMAGLQQSPRSIPNFSRPDRPMSSESRQSIYTRQSIDSRPSLDSRPSADVHYRNPSMTSNATRPSLSSTNPSRQGSQEEIPTPFAREINTSDSEAADKGEGSNQGQTYTYSKFTLPRGRAPDRNSVLIRNSWIEKQFDWDKEEHDKPVHSPVVATLASHIRKHSDGEVLQSSTRPMTPVTKHQPADELRRPRELALSSSNRSHSADPTATRPKISHSSTASVNTDSTERTIRATPLNQPDSTSDISAEEHLEIGIQAHSAGHTNKSTYHLRLAAKAGLPTAMLLYALACRHGWGMRPNQEEGVTWLRKAIDSSQVEISDLEQTLSNASRRSGKSTDPAVEAMERKKRKAQFSLAIYELGISYMNGWGCPKDRPLALRCYEIAGDWGDCDALAEAGYCYTQGIGCKKDLKKASTLYRKAAAGGMSMAGNSWIYKSKYMDEDAEKAKKNPDLALPKEIKDSKSSRSRSRTIWGRGKKEK